MVRDVRERRSPTVSADVRYIAFIALQASAEDAVALRLLRVASLNDA
jgi:hypothetical protein